MSSDKRDDMRTLLKTFGIQADEAVIVHLARNPKLEGLRLRLTLLDLTDYGEHDSEGELSLVVEGMIGRTP
jgi:hypothetical protein